MKSVIQGFAVVMLWAGAAFAQQGYVGDIAIEEQDIKLGARPEI